MLLLTYQYIQALYIVLCGTQPGLLAYVAQSGTVGTVRVYGVVIIIAHVCLLCRYMLCALL